MLSMMKPGLVKAPIERAPALARARNVDTAYFLCLVLREFMPAAWAEIETHRGGVLSENERRLLALYRERSAAGEIELDEERIRRLDAALSS